MSSRIKTTFLLLVLLQGLHSIEEYTGRLWEVFLPARLVSDAVADNTEKGFIIINCCLFIFGMLCWLIPVRKEYSFGYILIWFWIIIEMINGIGHPFWAIYRGTYFPGVITAPFLLIVSVYLCRLLLVNRDIRLNETNSSLNNTTFHE
jgi:hypothetical protein